MKAISRVFLSSIIVGIVSVLVFREHLLETVTTLLNYNNSNNWWNTSHGDSPQVDESHATSPQETTPAAANMSVPRAIRKVFLAVEQAEGAGARVRRSIGTPQLRNFSPFLMLDHFSVNTGSGFPDHPHRGQEVFTLLSSSLLFIVHHADMRLPCDRLSRTCSRALSTTKISRETRVPYKQATYNS